VNPVLQQAFLAGYLHKQALEEETVATGLGNIAEASGMALDTASQAAQGVGKQLHASALMRYLSGPSRPDVSKHVLH